MPFDRLRINEGPAPKVFAVSAVRGLTVGRVKELLG